MRASESHFAARATSGQHLDIKYDARTNALIYVEADWATDARGSAAARTVFREQLESQKVRRLPRRRAA